MHSPKIITHKTTTTHQTHGRTTTYTEMKANGDIMNEVTVYHPTKYDHQDDNTKCVMCGDNDSDTHYNGQPAHQDCVIEFQYDLENHHNGTTIDRTGCIGNTIKVAAGHYVNLANPSPESIDIQTVAAALSKMCRFGCHCPRFYSVAEHCIHATELAVSEGFVDEALCAVFLHDAAEAYIGDVVKPLKVMLPDYAVVEKRMQQAVTDSFGVDFERWPDTVKRFDRMMLKAEKLTLWPDDREQWTGFAEIDHRDVKFQFWVPDDAEREFLRFADTLGLIV